MLDPPERDVARRRSGGEEAKCRSSEKNSQEGEKNGR